MSTITISSNEPLNIDCQFQRSQTPAARITSGKNGKLKELLGQLVYFLNKH